MSIFLVVEEEGRECSWGAAIAITKTGVTVGRGGDCNLIIRGNKLPRQALKLKLVPDGAEVSSIDSGHHFLFAGTEQQVAILPVGSSFQMGGRTFRLEDKIPKRKKSSKKEVGSEPSFGEAFRSFLEHVGAPTQPEELLQRLLDGVVELFGAERGFVLLRQNVGDQLVPIASRSVDNLDELLAVSSTVTNEVLQSAKVVCVNNSQADKLTKEARSLALTALPRTILAAPLRRGRTVFGIVYIDRAWNAKLTKFGDERLLETVSSIAAGVLSAEATRNKLLSAKEKLSALSNSFVTGEKLVLGQSAASQKLMSMVDAAAPQDVTVLLSGETGTGKEVLARHIHKRSQRKNGPFVPVHCAALPHDLFEAELFGVAKGAFTGALEPRVGRFEIAEGGTVFLDELGEIPLSVQVKLLRVLQERRVTRLGSNKQRPLDFRLICATNVRLEEAVSQGTFREDLYYRVNVFRLEIPSLRDRNKDIELLAKHFLAIISRQLGKKIVGFDPKALAQLTSHPWPGNIRQLRNAIERAAIMESKERISTNSLLLGKETMPKTQSTSLADFPDSYDEARSQFEKLFFQSRLENYEGRMDKVAAATGISRSTLYRRLVNLGLAEKK